MVYFFINFTIHGLISLLLLMLLISTFRVNQQRKNKHGLRFFVPFIVALILLAQLSIFTLPRILDTTDVIRSEYSVIQGSVERIGYFNNTLTVDGETYYYNPMVYKPHVDDELRFLVTSYSGFVFDMHIISEE